MSQRSRLMGMARRQRPMHLSAEWVTFAIASLIVAVLIGLILFMWVTESQEDPILAISQTEAIHQERGAYYVPFTVTNVGGGTAEAVAVVAELRIDGQVAEAGEQQIDFLSSREEQAGVFIFKTNPKTGTLTLRASGYKLP